VIVVMVRISAAGAAVALAALGFVGSAASVSSTVAAPAHVVQAGSVHPAWQLPPCPQPNGKACGGL
jgi:hypothetical protein